MPGFKEQTCVDIVRDIRRINVQLDEVLVVSGSLNEEQINAVSALVIERGEKLIELRNQCAELSEDGFESSNEKVKNFWNSFGMEMSGSDKNRLALLKTKVDFAAQTLRTSMKRKSLLQYQRG